MYLSSRRVAVFVGVSALLAANQTKACAIALRPDEKLTYAYDRGIFSAVAAVRIVDSKYTHPPTGDSHPWSATATIDTMLMGKYEPQTVTFKRGGGSSACDNDIDNDNALPTRGERWMVYFWKDPNGEQKVWRTYPVAVAAAADPLVLSAELTRKR